MHASRNIRLCTKDCLCLYACPTGATDTETGQIDKEKCIGCGNCVKVCPSHAICMVAEGYPPQRNKSDSVKDSMLNIAQSKSCQEQLAREMAVLSKDPALEQFFSALEKSNRIMAEDALREGGYMLPQSRNGYNFLLNLQGVENEKDFPKQALERLLELIKVNE